jgi:hypothetical protein
VGLHQLPEGALVALPRQHQQHAPVTALSCLAAHGQHHIDPPGSPGSPTTSADVQERYDDVIGDFPV